MDDPLPKRIGHCLLIIPFAFSVSAASVMLVAFIFPFPTEPWRNLAGFVIVPAISVGSLISAIAFAFKKTLKNARAVIASVIVAFGGLVVFSVGGMLECPFVYAFTGLHIKRAKAWDGSPISKILGTNIDDLTTDDYIANNCSDYSTITIFRMSPNGRLAGYYFAYDTKSNVLVPLSEKAASDFPALMPPGDRLVDWRTLTANRDGTEFGDAILAMPANWFHEIDQRENPPLSRLF